MRARRPTLEQQQRKSRWFRRSLLGLLGIGGLGIGWFVVLLPIRVIECETDMHTYCREEQERALQSLRGRPWLWTTSLSAQTLDSLRTTDPSLTQAHLRRGWPTQMHVTLEQAEPLLPIEHQGEKYVVHANGVLSRREDEEQPAIVLPAELVQDEKVALDSDALRQLEVLRSGIARLSAVAPVAKITWINKHEIVVLTTGGKRWIMTLGDETTLRRQLATLQAFLQSPTIEGTYGEVDVRFKDLVVR